MSIPASLTGPSRLPLRAAYRPALTALPTPTTPRSSRGASPLNRCDNNAPTNRTSLREDSP